MNDEIVLTLPRERRFYDVAYLVVSGLGARLNLTMDNLADLQLALDGLLPRRETSGEVTAVVFEARADGSTHHVEYTRVASTWRQRLTCQAGEESAVPQYRLVRYAVYR